MMGAERGKDVQVEEKKTGSIGILLFYAKEITKLGFFNSGYEFYKYLCMFY